jgi:hypothetical protein
MTVTRVLAAKHTRAAVALAAAGLVAVGSPGVANAYPGPGGQRDQEEPTHGYADATGGAAVPMNWAGNWLFGNVIPHGNYQLAGSPSAALDIDPGGDSGGMAAPSMPIVMPAGQSTPAPAAGQTAAPQDGQSTIPAQPPMPIVLAGAP